MALIEETAFAKINLDLRVCRRRADGYHDLDSIVVFADLGDRLTFEPADDVTLSIEGPFAKALAHDDDNLVVRAAKALADAVGRIADARITLEKRLPVASGLGGGSADAAATLRGLTRLWGLSLGLADLLPLARELGADLPVCLGSRAVRMEGTGDQLTPLSLPVRPPMMLVNPGIAISTPAAFHDLDVHSGARGPDKPIPEAEPAFSSHLESSINDLEAPAARMAPVIGEVVAAMDRQPGCSLARMSGSGATCFGLFDSTAERDHAVKALSEAQPSWWVVGTGIR
ncbi:MAG: 4-(cytidine 5'-diphospho)-2-C-methyl-D-erythritol kinase [Geminicoccaceae bacterium]